MEVDVGPSNVCCSKNEIEFFEPRQINTVMQQGKFVDVHPTSTVSASDAPIEFFVNGSSDDYIDLNQTMLVVRCSVTKEDGTTSLGATKSIAPVNNFMHSLFSDVSLVLGDKQVEGGTFMYPYRAYFHNLLTYGSSTKKGLLRTVGWVKDVPSATMHDKDDAAWIKRAGWIISKGELEFAGSLCLDTLVQSKYLLNNMSIKIKLSRAKPDFYFMKHIDGETVKLTITSAILYVRRVQMTPSVILQNEAALLHRNALYPIQHTEITTYTISKGSLSHNKESLFRGKMPKLIIVGMVTNAAFNGSYATNPFNFQDFDLGFMALFKDGESVPGRPYTPNFKKNMCSREYVALHQALELYNVDESRNITIDDFLNGYTLMAFNLSPDMEVSGPAQTLRDGNLRLEMRFTVQLPQTINMVVLAVFDSQIEITKNRDVLLDYNV